jgi:hypothetical protein
MVWYLICAAITVILAVAYTAVKEKGELNEEIYVAVLAGLLMALLWPLLLLGAVGFFTGRLILRILENTNNGRAKNG